MKQRKWWLGLAAAPFALAMLAFAQPALANDFNGTCAQYPGTFDGTGNVTISNTGACTLPAVSAAGTVSITSSGTVTALSGISGASVTVNATSGAINASTLTASNGQISLTTASGAITADTLTALTNIAVDSSAALTFTNTAQSTNGSVDLKSKTALQTKKVTAVFSLKIANSVSGNVTIDGGAATDAALTVANGPMDVRSKALLTITGTTTSTLNEIQLESQGDLKADAIGAGSHVRTESINGKVNVTAAINSNTNDQGGNMLITAKNNVRTGALKVVGQTTGGAIQIDSNKGGGNVLFTIGATNTNNGVNGSIDVSGTTGGGTDLLLLKRGVFITNGTTSSGGIRLASAASLKLLNTSSRAGGVWLNAKDGTMTLPGGVAIDANGASNQFSGFVFLLAKTINFGNNPTLRAVQGKTVTGNAHGVALATETINFQGPNGLKIQVDGSGKDVFNPAFAYIIPEGSMTSTSTNDFRNLTWTIPSIAAVETTDKPVSMIGTGASPLTMTANGSDTAIAVRGNGINISTAGAITLTAKGKSNHTITIRDTGPFGDAKGLTFGTTATPSITLDVSGDNTVPGAGNASGGDIRISSDVLTLNAPVYNFQASGPPTGNGDGGTIRVASTTQAAISSSSAISMTADAATSASGQGNAQLGDLNNQGLPRAIQLFPGGAPLTFGPSNTPGAFTLSANGGKAGGNGGLVYVASGPVTLLQGNSINAKSLAGNGNGGRILFQSFIQNIANLAKVSATGTGNGTGGKFEALYQAPIGGLKVNNIIKVDGGDSLKGTAESDFGRITLNNTQCQQRTTALTWPVTFWNCDHPDGSTAADQSAYKAAEKLHVSMSTGLSNQGVHIYIFTNVNKFKDFHGVGPLDTSGVSGYSDVNLKVSATFRFELYSSGDKNISSFHSGTIIHELGHQLDENVWKNASNIPASSSNDAWLTANGNATTAFDAADCAVVVDPDRTDPQVGLNAICFQFDGVPDPNGPFPEPHLSNTDGLSVYGGGFANNKSERFVRSFAMAYSRKLPTVIFMQLYNQKFDNRVPAEQQYMDQMILNGQP